MNRIAVSAEGLEPPPWTERLRAFALSALDALAIDGWDVSVLLCDDAFMADLNERYRGKEGPTDVLSFEQGEDWDDPEAGPRHLAGDIVISLETLPRNAAEFGIAEDEELRRLVVHGLLHLSGLDHATNEAAEPMLARQEEVLASISGERIL
ncbi:MAG TPA: rRNA maturation RNase YbeY [Spirochaetales bacterium]|nr:rRNA maturation RNase YbeY [Spirochaetales bacterium]